MSIWSYLWPFGRKAKPAITADPLIPAPGTHVPPSDFLGGGYRKPTPPPMQSVVRGGWDLRPARRPIEQSRIVPRRHGGVDVGDNSGEIADAAVTLITTISDTIPAPAPVPEPRHTPVETPHHSAPSHSHSHDSGQTYHHVDTSHHVHVDSSPSFSDGGGSVSTGC